MPITITRILKPEDWREKQLTTLKAVGEKNYRKRITMPKKSPITAGIDAEAKWAEAIKGAIEKKSRKIGLEATSDDEWLGYAESIGAPRLVEGVTKREPEVKEFIEKWQPILTDHLTKIDAMATVTLSERIAKAVSNIEGLAALKGAVKMK